MDLNNETKDNAIEEKTYIMKINELTPPPCHETEEKTFQNFVNLAAQDEM